jgi:glycosyltransferase involved in cell wall biosynthesis
MSFVNLLVRNGFRITLITINSEQNFTRTNLDHQNILIGTNYIERNLLKFAKFFKGEPVLFWFLVIFRTLIRFTRLHSRKKFRIAVNHDYLATGFLVNFFKPVLKNISPFKMVIRISAPFKVLASEYYFIPKLEKKIIARAELFNIRIADIVTYASASFLKKIERFVGKSRATKVRLLPPLPDLTKNNVPRQKLCIYSGRIQDGKGVEDMIKAWVLLTPLERNEYQLQLIGPDMAFSKGQSLQNYLSGKYLDNNPSEYGVTFSGNIDHDQIGKNLSKAKIFIAPSRLDNYPNSVAEAMVCGLYIIGTKDTGVEDILRDYNYKTCKLFKVKDYKELTKILKELLGYSSLPKPDPSELERKRDSYNREIAAFFNKISLL